MRKFVRLSHVLLFLVAAWFIPNHQVFASEMLTRADWNARKPSGSMTQHEPTRITIHHTASRQRPGIPLSQKLRSLQAFSQTDALLADGRRKAAWADIPYHFYIDANGQLAEGRSMLFAGDTNTNYSPQGHIGIAVEGNFETEKPNSKQLESLVELLALLLDDLNLDASAIDHHGSYAATACPGQHLEALLPDVIARASQMDPDQIDEKPIERSKKAVRPRSRPDAYDSK